MIHHRRTTCRLCQSPDVECVFSLESAPLAEAYLPPVRAAEGDTRYPLDVFLCRSCGGVQLLDVIDAGHLADPGVEFHRLEGARRQAATAAAQGVPRGVEAAAETAGGGEGGKQQRGQVGGSDSRNRKF